MAPGAQAGGAPDPDATFRAVVGSLESWGDQRRRNATVGGDLRSYLDEELNGDSGSVWDRDIVERRRGSTAADVVVNGEIGVKLVGRLGAPGARDLVATLVLLSERYNYVAVYWLDTSSAGTDHRRNVERRLSSRRLEVEELRFVGRSPGRSASSQRPAAEFARPTGVVLAGLLVAVGAGTVLWLFSWTGGLIRLFLLGVAGVFTLSLVLGLVMVT